MALGESADLLKCSFCGKSQKQVQQLIAAQSAFVKDFAKLMDDLASTTDANGPLLDNTLLLLGGGMGNASIHSTRNLPILLAGGGLRHGQHIKANRPLGDLFVTILQRMGVETGKFSTSRGNLNELLG